ncbi:unnamed protein product [Paramecium octaurelia]|uniref:Citrate synthase n=1 Tax=Paramecium octaurelia TaxID=43137 RepID=A0A8S1UTL2_PAROT|nr:unnamed protein product [Paramecium octaurelia]
MIKIDLIVIGNLGSGKTSLIQRFIDQDAPFQHNYLPTLGLNLVKKEFDHQGQQIKLCIWDTAGQDKYFSLTKSYFQRADGVIMVFDIADKDMIIGLNNTLSDFYSGITTAIGTLRGPLHGGANEAAMQYLEPLRSIPQADQFLNSRYQSKQLIMGFGHRVYKKEDPRSPIIKDFSLQLSKTASGDPTLLAVSQHIEKRMIEEKKIYPNLDFYSASAYKQCGVPTPMFTAIFVISRMTGWGGHIIEQRSNNKLMRPVSDYTGPAKKQFVPIEMRNNANL